MSECIVIDFPAQVDVALEEVARTLFRHGLQPNSIVVNFDIPSDDHETPAAVAEAWSDVSWFHDVDGSREWGEGRVGPIQIVVTSPLRYANEPSLAHLMRVTP